MPKVSRHAAEVVSRVDDAGDVSTEPQRAILRIVRSSLEEEILSVPLREGTTPQELTQLWESEWGVPHASAIRFEAPEGSESRWLNPREDAVPAAPASVRLHCRGKGSVLTALASAFRRRGGAAELVRHGDGWQLPTWSMAEVLKDRERKKHEEAQGRLASVAGRAQEAAGAGRDAAEEQAGHNGAGSRLEQPAAAKEAPVDRRPNPATERPDEQQYLHSDSQGQEPGVVRLGEGRVPASPVDAGQDEQRGVAPGQSAALDPQRVEPERGDGAEEVPSEEAEMRRKEAEERRWEGMNEEQRQRWKERQERQERNRQRREERERKMKGSSEA